MSVRIRLKRPVVLRFLAAGACVLTGFTASTRAAEPQSASAILQELRSFREMVIHLVSDNFTHLGYAAGKSKEDSDKLAEKYKNIKTRSEFLAALNDSYDYGDKVLAGLNDQNAMDKVVAMRGEHTNRVGAVLEAFEDEMDHYGNFVVYLRLNGVVPPETENRDKQVEENMHH